MAEMSDEEYEGIKRILSKSIAGQILKSLKGDSYIQGWKWIFYILGWITGLLNPIFWLIMYGLHMSNNYGQLFFNKDLNRRVFIWGVMVAILCAISIVLIFTLE